MRGSVTGRNGEGGRETGGIQTIITTVHLQPPSGVKWETASGNQIVGSLYLKPRGSLVPCLSGFSLMKNVVKKVPLISI